MMTTIPFDRTVKGLLLALGYKVTEHAAHWEDIGGPENGPMLDGHGAYDEWTCGDRYVIVYDDWVTEIGVNPPDPPEAS